MIDPHAFVGCDSQTKFSTWTQFCSQKWFFLWHIAVLLDDLFVKHLLYTLFFSCIISFIFSVIYHFCLITMLRLLYFCSTSIFLSISFSSLYDLHWKRCLLLDWRKRCNVYLFVLNCVMLLLSFFCVLLVVLFERRQKSSWMKVMIWSTVRSSSHSVLALTLWFLSTYHILNDRLLLE